MVCGVCVMKKVLFGAIGVIMAGAALPAAAADLPDRGYTKAPPTFASYYSWTGCYIGIEGGGNWGRTRSTATGNPDPAIAGLPITGSYSLTGAMVGGTVGCNYQAGNWVLGVENDLSWTDKSGTANDVAPFDPAV